MPRLRFSERFADDLAGVNSPRLEGRIMLALNNIEALGDFGSPIVPESVSQRFGEGVRKVAVGPFDLVYTHRRDEGVALIEALVPGRSAR